MFILNIKSLDFSLNSVANLQVVIGLKQSFILTNYD